MRKYPFPRRLGCTALVAGALAAAALPVHAQSGAEDPPDDAVRVYEDLIRQFGTARTPPRLQMEWTRNALEYRAQDHMVLMSDEAYQVASDMGGQAPAALAYLLGHELAHFYADHGFSREYPRDFASLESTAAIRGSRILETEAQADFEAGFKAYLAGYDAIPIAPEVLRRLADEFPDLAAPAGAASDRAHPPIEDRVRILELVRRDLDRFIAGFEGGVRLLVAGAYPEAGRFFAHIAQSFPSREILSNAGVAKALEAIDLLGVEVRWAYPFELDLETRLRRDRDRSPGAVPGPGGNRQRAMRLLTEAEALFTRATQADPQYATAHVNLAAVNVLAGNTFLALGNLGRAEQLAREHGEPVTAAHAAIVRGIALAECETELPTCQDAGAVEAAFDGAAGVAPRLAAVNRAAWRGEPTPAPAAVGGENAGGAEESIGGVSRDPRELQAFLGQPPVTIDMLIPAEGGEPAMNLRVKKSDQVDGYLFGGQTPRGREHRFAVILSTPEGYTGASARGIRVGSASAEVTGAYGEPGRVVAARQGEFWVYDLTMVAFLVNEAGTVDSWMVWEFLER